MNKNKPTFWEKIFFIKPLREIPRELQREEQKKKHVVPPSGAASKRDIPNYISLLNKSIEVINPDFDFEIVPLIRKLTKLNSDMGQAFSDIIQLANTGIKIKFDPGVKPTEQEKMKKYINSESKKWVTGVAGLDGLVNKIFANLMIGGAVANEWVPNINLDGIEEVRFLYPERIRWTIEKNGKYQAYQLLKHKRKIDIGDIDLIKLNHNTFNYVGLGSDLDIPYGIPPYSPSLKPISMQEKMLENINFIVEMMGIMGHVEVLMEKPDQKDGESETAYIRRLEGILADLKDRMSKGVRDGISAGFKDDHEFNFNQTTKSAEGATAIFEQNELLIASGLKYDAAFLGRAYGSGGEFITILFTKMLSQLTNLQTIAKHNLEFGINLALRLKGFKYDYLDIEFNKSTITDDLKLQQAREVLIRNLHTLRVDGIINQDQYAEEAGYRKPYKPEPIVPFKEQSNKAEDAKKKQDREKDKDSSDRKVRDKNKPQGTTKDRRTEKE